MRPYVSQVLAGTNWLDDFLFYDRDTLAGWWRLVRQLRSLRLDVILLMTNSFSTAGLAWLSGTPRRVGFALYGRNWLLTDRLYTLHRAQPRSAVDHYLDVVGVTGCVADSRTPELGTTDDDEKAADLLWHDAGWSERRRVVVLNTGGAYGAAKSWPAQHFADLARRLAQAHDAGVLILCGPAERDAARAISQQAEHPNVRSLAERQLSIGLSKACVRRAQLLISTDSGPRHFAAAFGVPAVTIFGPTDPRWSHNYHPPSIDLQLDVPCGPCGKRVCPLKHHSCLRDLTVDHVEIAALSLLERGTHDQAA
jgi:heptosyltransferase-2